ncbi:MAG TPA: potassium channel family protein [Candidatus Saccharimonadia bacterium]|nr:potassium channel family protein [Candidatus Saccharimonadia bacterium]
MEQSEIDELQAEHESIRVRYRLTAGLSLSVLIIGAVFFHIVERLSWINAFYFCTVTLTTVGYGDIVPKTNAGKIFDMFYILVGIGIIATFAHLLVKNAGLRRQLSQAKRNAKPSLRAPKNSV